MSRRLERVGLWLGSTVGGAGLNYAALVAPSNTAPVLLGIMWVLGAALLAVGILGFATEAVGFVNRVLPDEKPKPLTPNVAAVVPASPSAPAPAKPAPAKQGKHIVQVTPEYLIGLFKTHTTLEAERLMADFLGKWMYVSGTVRDISQLSDGEMHVPIDPDSAPELLVFLRFRGPWAERVKTLRRGAKIRVIGKIDQADSLGMRLRSCELVEGESTQ